jgi:hypothetical protein
MLRPRPSGRGDHRRGEREAVALRGRADQAHGYVCVSCTLSSPGGCHLVPEAPARPAHPSCKALARKHPRMRIALSLYRAALGIRRDTQVSGLAASRLRLVAETQHCLVVRGHLVRPELDASFPGDAGAIPGVRRLLTVTRPEFFRRLLVSTHNTSSSPREAPDLGSCYMLAALIVFRELNLSCRF